jgi:hypothetical protein
MGLKGIQAPSKFLSATQRRFVIRIVGDITFELPTCLIYHWWKEGIRFEIFINCSEFSHITRLLATPSPTPPLTTGNSLFAVCPKLCRAHYIGRTTKKTFVVRLSHDAWRKNTRQTNSLQCVFPWRTTNIFPHQTLPLLQPLACSLPLPCTRTRCTTKTFPLPCAVGKHIRLPCVFLRRTTKYFFKNEFCTSFYFSTTKTLFCTLYFNVVHVFINLLSLTIICHLKRVFVVYIKFELQVRKVIE